MEQSVPISSNTFSGTPFLVKGPPKITKGGPFDPHSPISRINPVFKVARYSFSRSIPPKFEHKLRRHKQSFGKIATTVELDKDENLL